MTLASLAALVLLVVRPGIIVLATPLFGAGHAPAIMRIGVIILVAWILAPLVALPETLSAGAVTMVVLREVAIGLALSLAIRIFVAAGELAGHFSGYQIGLSLGSLIDPLTGVRNNILAILYANVVIIICFASNAHHALLRALVDSYAALPVGLGAIGDGLAGSVATVLGLVFVIGVRMAAPVIVVLLVVELALGLLARVAPSLNVITAGAPVRVVAGLLVIAASLGALPGLMARYMPAAFQAAAGTAGAFR